MRNQLLRNTDWASLAHSLEVRVPLIDATLLKKLSPVFVNSHRFKGKTLLVNVSKKALPIEIINRAKTGFTTPIHKWLECDSSISYWKEYQSLNRINCPWARRWATCVANSCAITSKI